MWDCSKNGEKPDIAFSSVPHWLRNCQDGSVATKLRNCQAEDGSAI